MNMKPLVGVMPLWDERKQSLWMLPGYMEGLVQAGAIPIIFPLSENASDLSALLEMCQGILFTGGQDVSPRVYGETPLNDSVSCCPQRDRMESIILDLAIEANKSVLGICRGIQFINAALGGTLYQDLPLQHPAPIPDILAIRQGRYPCKQLSSPGDKKHCAKARHNGRFR